MQGLEQFLFDFEHFSLMFPRQEQQQEQQQQSFFKDFWALLAVKNTTLLLRYAQTVF